jgi:excisionase family DNA binding protein
VARPLPAYVHLFAGDPTLRKRQAALSETPVAAPMFHSSILGAQTDLMTVGELASKLRCHPTTVYRLLNQKKLPGFRVGADWRFSSQTIDRWIVSQQPKVL